MRHHVIRGICTFAFLGVLTTGNLLAFQVSEANTRGLEREDDRDTTKVDRGLPEEMSSLIYDEKYALIIGIDEYRDPNVTDLEYAVNDAKAIENMLISTYGYPPENVTVLTNSFADRVSIIEAMEVYSAPMVSENSQLVVFFAGHGDTQNGNGYLLPYDVAPTNLASSAIPMATFRNQTMSIKPKHVLFLTDACYGGLSIERSASSGQDLFLRQVLQEKVHQVITAGGAGETVIEHSSLGHSAFTYTLLDVLGKGLADSDLNGLITATELFHSLRFRVSELATNLNGRQTPQLSRLSNHRGEFVFFRDEAAFTDLTTINNLSFENDIEKLEERAKKPVRITSNVDFARVLVDGVEQEDALVDGKLTLLLLPGVHTISLEKDKYDSQSKEVALSTQQDRADLYVEMKPRFGVMQLDVAPEDAAVYIDDVFSGAGNFSRELEQGEHSFRVVKDGYTRFNEAWVVVAGDTTYRKITLEPIFSTVSISSDPAPSDVWLNDEFVGQVTNRPVVLKVPYGKSTVQVKREDYQDGVLEFLVTEPGQESHRIKLERTFEWTASKIYREQLISNFRKAVIFSGMAAGAYFGHSKLENEFQALEELPDGAGEDDPNYKLYQTGRYVALGLSGVLALSAVSKLFRAASLDRSKILERLYREDALSKGLTLSVGPRKGSHGIGISATLSF